MIIHLEAIGAVLRSTALLEPIRRKYPRSHITWVTARPSDQLLKHNPSIDRVLTTSAEDLLVVAALEFDVAFVIDKGLKSVGVLKQTKAHEVFGFVSDSRSGA
ncbi:MAG: glycosyltransferase family 9 protein, partial [Bdellovibrionales bacterium]|nr:glycosyltransferase family 9 protein [Bdellovibrionales bacterium]